MRIVHGLTMLLLSLAGCSDSSPEAQIRSLIPQASSIPNADFEILANSENPTSDLVKSHSLSLLLMNLPVSTSPVASNNFEYLDGVKPSVLVEAMWKSSGKGYATMVQPEFIESVDCKIVGESAIGKVYFKAVGLYAGKVEFTATLKAGCWQIEQFRLPGYHLKTSLGSDGVWKKEAWSPHESKTEDGQQATQVNTTTPGE